MQPIPPHIGIGAPEDTLQSCFGLIPKPPHKDIIKYNLNANKVIFIQYGENLSEYRYFWTAVKVERKLVLDKSK